MNLFVKTASVLCLTLMMFVGALMNNATAQVSGKAFEGFQGSSKDPVQIEADQLEVLDEQSRAIFQGNVKVRQGTSLITTSKLVVKYKKNANTGGQGDIQQLDMSGGLIATSKENTVTADQGTYFVDTEQIILTGKKVVISQGDNVAVGTKLVANLKTNKAVLSGGRVKSVFTPGSQKKTN